MIASRARAGARETHPLRVGGAFVRVKRCRRCSKLWLWKAWRPRHRCASDSRGRMSA